MMRFFHRRRRQVLCVTLAVLTVLPPNSWQRLACATDGPTVGQDDCGDPPASCPECDCSPCPCPSEGAPADGAEGVTQTAAPINFSLHSVFESARDLYIPGAEVDFEHVRTYDSRMSRGSSGFVFAEGYRWHGGAAGPYLTHPNGSGDLELYVHARSKRRFVHVSGNTYTPPVDSALTLSVTGSNSSQLITINNTETDEQLIFYGLHVNMPAYRRGRLKERKRRSSTVTGNVYSYNSSNGTVDWCLTAGNYLVDYAYNDSSRLESISVYAGPDSSYTLLQHVAYTYRGDVAYPSTDIGEIDADLVQVKVAQRASTDSGNTPDDLSIVRHTQYRYYREDFSVQIKSVFESSAIQRLLDADSGDSYSTPSDLLSAADSAVISVAGGTQSLSTFASRSFTHYESTNIATPTNWPSGGTSNSPESLLKYASSAVPLYIQAYDTFWHAAVESETIGGGCSSCSSSPHIGVKKLYYYLQVADWYNGDGKNNPKLVVRIVVEDTLDGNGNAAYRTIYGVNYAGTAIRTAVLTDPLNPSADNIWCSSIVLDSNWRVEQRRMPSAHKGKVTSDAELEMFLNPTEATGGTLNDEHTVNSDLGVVYHFQYVNVIGKRPTATLVSQGTGGTQKFLQATDYGDTNSDGSGVDVTEGKMAYKTYTYHDEATAGTRSSGIVTAYAYTYWNASDDLGIQSKVTTLPTIPNGSGSAATQNGSNLPTSTREYYDRLGQLRWTVDGEGYINYYSYHPVTGQLAYVAVDVDPSTAPAGATGNDTKWLSWSNDGDGDSTYDTAAKPGTRDIGGFATDPAPLKLVTQTEYDGQGRVTKSIEPGGGVHETKYFANGTLHLPYINGSGDPTLPPSVSKTDAAGVLIESYTVTPGSASTASTSLPSGTLVSRTTYQYNAVNGQAKGVRRYHKLGGETLGTNYYETNFYYDSLGRRGATVQYVDTGRYQVSAQVYDVLGRVIETRVGVATTKPTTYDALDDAINPTSPPSGFAGWASKSKTVYDSGGVGDGYRTSVKQYIGLLSSSFIESLPKYTYRGHIRGVETKNGTPGTGGGDFGPYEVRDIDWMGRTIASSTYSTEPDWTTLLTGTGYVDFVHNPSGNSGAGSPTGSDYLNTTITKYDDLGRVYQTLRFPGTQASDRFVTNNYYDRRNNLVATVTEGSAAMEYAYDGAGRQYEQRTVIALESTKYASGAFDYVEPEPHPDVASLSGGDSNGVIAMNHTAYDAAGNVTESHDYESHHDDTNGINLPSGGDYVRSTQFAWYDAANRQDVSAEFGSGDGTGSTSAWQYTAVPTRGGAITWSDSEVQDGDVLLTTYGYDDAGRQNTVTVGTRQNASANPTTSTTKTFFDDLGRRVAVAENWVDFAVPTTNIGGGTNNERDRVTAFAYNGLGHVTTLTAHNAGTPQVTTYEYADNFNASLNTKTIYPDSTGSSDSVTMTYALDGDIVTRTDQRGVQILYLRNARRQVTREAATISGAVDGTVEAIGRTYDDFGRTTHVTSYAETAATTVVNQIKYTYDTTYGTLIKTEQDHAGAVGGGEPSVQYAYDDSDSGGVFTNGLRQQSVTYPDTNDVKFFNYSGTVNDLLSRVSEIWETNTSGTQLTSYEYMGSGRVARTVLHINGSTTRHSHADRDNNGVYEEWDRFGRIIDFGWSDTTSSPTYDDRYQYTYDLAGNRTARNNRVTTSGTTNVFDQDYEYDGLQRLIDTDQGTANDTTHQISTMKAEERWTLDQLGNWGEFKKDINGDGAFAASTELDQDRLHNKVNELDNDDNHANSPSGVISEISGQAVWPDPEHDAAGNMTKMPQPEDLDASYTATYDAWNRLVTLNDGTSDVQVNEYDGLHRRVERISNGGSPRHFYWNENWQCVEERVGTATTPDRQHVYHPYYIDAPALQYAGTTNRWLAHDTNFNVTILWIASDGSVRERYRYDAYGNTYVLNASWNVRSGNVTGWTNEYQYTGRRVDPTGLYQYRYRYYHSQMGRFVGRDPVVYFGGMNLYGYVSGSPTMFVDPIGLAKNYYKPTACFGIYSPPIEGINNLGTCSVTCICNGKPKQMSEITYYPIAGQPPRDATTCERDAKGYEKEEVCSDDDDGGGNSPVNCPVFPKGPGDKDDNDDYKYGENELPAQSIPQEWMDNQPAIAPAFGIDPPQLPGFVPPPIHYGPMPTDDECVVIEGKVIAGGITLYVMYRVCRFLPSLAPPLWWTAPGNAFAP